MSGNQLEKTEKTEKTMEKKLEVRNLTISFRTNNGMVQAVRNISFDLMKGETLAIAGESGSGKSVTTRAVMGILAGNAVVEGGEILYDGRDLLKIPEEEFHTLRGHRLSMVFQDPLSALNPIMKIGKQLTEAMLLSAKERRKDGKARFERRLSDLEHALALALSEAGRSGAQKEAGDLCRELKSRIQAGNLESVPFEKELELALAHARKEANARRSAALTALSELLPHLEREPLAKADCRRAAQKAERAVKAAINPLEVRKDNAVYVFGSTLNYGLRRYFEGLQANPREEKRFRRETQKHDRLEAKGKFAPGVPPLHLTDTGRIRRELLETVKGLASHLEEEESGLTTPGGLCRDLAEAWKDASEELTPEEARKRAIALMGEVGIPNPEERFNQYPFEFSGGMRQRIVIAIALSANPDILICDEPTTALDVTIQAQILELINRLKRERHLSVIFITHDLGVVANMADRIAVMYAGKIVELGTAEDVFYDPRHPYTWALLSSMPDLETKEKLRAIPGTPPNMILPPKGDAFAARNEYAMEIDFEEEPPMFSVSPTHKAATWLLDPRAPKTEMPEVVRTRIARMRERKGEGR